MHWALLHRVNLSQAGLVWLQTAWGAKEMFRTDERIEDALSGRSPAEQYRRAEIVHHRQNCDGRCNETCMVTVSCAWLVFLLAETA